jgi:hypothetical protein
MRKYESLARKREQDIQKAAEKASKQAAKDNSGPGRVRPVYLSTLHPPHLQSSTHLRTSRDRNSGTNGGSSYGYGYGGCGYGHGYCNISSITPSRIDEMSRLSWSFKKSLKHLGPQVPSTSVDEVSMKSRLQSLWDQYLEDD